MNCLLGIAKKGKNYFSSLRPLFYNGHPEYVSKLPKTRNKELELMRDLRLWVIENIPDSKNFKKYHSEVDQLTREIQHYESLRLLLFILGYSSLFYFFFMRLDDYSLRRQQDFEIYDMPMIQWGNRGLPMLHPGVTEHQRLRRDEDAWNDYSEKDI